VPRLAFLPTTPLLFPQVATGAAQELQALRDASQAAARWACDGASSVAVLTPLPRPPAQLPTWSLTGYGITIGEGPEVPLEVAVARWLLGERVPQVLTPGDPRLTAHDAVLVMGDGSAARSEKAPLHFDPHAAACDETAVTALRRGDARALGALDLSVCEQVGATGPAVWASAAREVSQVETSSVDALADPYGVLYVVARWSVRWAARA
jgi:hypothetical protein